MDKSLLIVSASPRKNGVGARVTGDMINMLPKDIKIKTVSAYELNPKPCIACGLCEKQNACIYGDMDEFFSLYAAADFVLFVTPVYNMSVPSPFKAMLERTQRYYNMHFVRKERPTFEKPKKCGLVIVAGKGENKPAETIARSVQQALSVMNGTLDGQLYVKNTDNGFVYPSPALMKSIMFKFLL